MKRAACVVILSLAGLASSSASAQPTPGFGDARTYFEAGSAHFQAHQWQEALAAFERANALVPSPNTELLIARCLRELGQSVEAVKRFDSTALHAKKRVDAGEAKYQQAGEAAAREGEAIRRTLGTLRIRVAQGSGQGAVSLDGKATELAPDGTATVLAAPGPATVEFSDRGRVQRQTVTLLAGAVVDVEFSAGASPPSDPVAPPEKAASSQPWVWAAIGAGALTAVGGGVYLGFNSASRATYDDLAARCGPNRCTERDRADADRGEQQQTIAMVGLAVGAVAAVATVAFTVIALRRGPSRVARVRPMSAMLTW